MQSGDAALELREDVLLIATTVGFGDAFVLREAAVIGDVEEVTKVGADAGGLVSPDTMEVCSDG